MRVPQARAACRTCTRSSSPSPHLSSLSPVNYKSTHLVHRYPHDSSYHIPTSGGVVPSGGRILLRKSPATGSPQPGDLPTHLNSHRLDQVPSPLVAKPLRWLPHPARTAHAHAQAEAQPLLNRIYLRIQDPLQHQNHLQRRTSTLPADPRIVRPLSLHQLRPSPRLNTIFGQSGIPPEQLINAPSRIAGTRNYSSSATTSSSPLPNMSSTKSFYDLKAELPGTKGVLDFSELKGKVVLIVNVASQCGFTPQYTGLQKVHDKYKDKDFVLLGFPCNQFGGQEPGSDDQISEFCTVNHGVTFPLMKKSDVNGDNVNEVFKWLKEQKSGLLGLSRIKWNFEKFLVNKEGKVVNRWASTTTPEAIDAEIAKLI